MAGEFGLRISTAGHDVCLAVRDDRWHVSMKGARRIGRDWFLQILAIGPRACTFTVRMAVRPHGTATVRRILTLVSDALHADSGRGHVYLELDPQSRVRDPGSPILNPRS